MKKKHRPHIKAQGIFATVFCFLVHSPFLPYAQPPALINYQGRLVHETNPVIGEVSMSLRLFDSEIGGALLYEDSNVVTVIDGLYSTQLGDHTVAGNLRDVLAVSSQLFLEVAVDGVPLAPRERLASVGYALIPGVRGIGNVEIGLWSTVGGGEKNFAGGDWSTVSGGWTNLASGKFSVIGGGERNIASGESGSVIGGRFNTAAGSIAIVGGEGNVAGDYAIALGLDNRAISYASGIFSGDDNTITGTEYAVIAGGHLNQILAATEYSAIIGGEENVIGPTSRHAVVIGGKSNHAGGDYSFASGRNAEAAHDGTFVWGDASDSVVSSSTSNQVTFRATGGFRIITGADTNTGVEVAPGSGSWTSLSDENAKKNIQPADGPFILQQIRSLPIYMWSYKTQDDSIRHIGPTAQDFHAAFAVGDLSTGITQVDADGVALAAIQALARQNDALKKENERLREEVEAIKARLVW